MTAAEKLLELMEEALDGLIADPGARQVRARQLAQAILCVLHESTNARLRGVADKELALYWLAREHHAGRISPESSAALAALGYDSARIERVLALGEPGRQP